MYTNEITKAGYSLSDYLTKAKRKASKYGLNPKLLTISTNPTYKLNYDGINFGSSTNNDFIIYSMLAKAGKITKDEALTHKKAYLARASNIKGNWKQNPTSKNNLAINILW
jgi:hypothetical protein